IASSSMMRADFVWPIAGIDVRNSVTLRRPSTPSGASKATRNTSSGLRAALAISAFTAARARRAATAAREAATRSTSGGADAVFTGSDTHGSDLVGAAGDRVGDAVGPCTQDGAGLAHDHAGGQGPEQDPEVGDLAALVAESGSQDRESGTRGLRVRVDARKREVGRGAQHDAGLARLFGRDEHLLDGAEALIGAERHRIGLEARARAEPRLAVGLDARADVAALHVGDDEETRVARLPEDPLEHGVARCSVAFEEG